MNLLLLLAACGPDAPPELGSGAAKAPSGEFCDGEDNDGDGAVDEDCGACEMLYTRVKSWWLAAECVIDGEGTGRRLTPIRVGSTNTYATTDTLMSFLASPGATDKQRLGQQILVGKLNAKAFGIGGIPYHDVDGDGDLETVDELLAVADGRFDGFDTTAQIDMFVLLGQLNAEGNALPMYIDQNCARDAEICDGLDNDGDGAVDDHCGCVEACDGVDNNGDGAIDEGGPDNDVDGYQCDDCDDARNRTHPGAYDVPENAIDDDCDGADAVYTYDFDADVQPLFDSTCVGCHAGADAEAGLDLSPGLAYANIVSVASTQLPSLSLVQPASTAQSYLYRKVVGTHTAIGGTGGRMPLGGPYLSLAQAGILGTWITEGAPPSCADRDGDGWTCTDCDDADPAVFPGAAEVRGDEIDQDCDGADLLFTYGLDEDIQPLLTASCVGCHGATVAQLGLRLDDGFALAATVDVPATQLPSMDLVEPGDHTRSYLYHKLAGSHRTVGGAGNRMPPGGPFFLPELLDIVAVWIDEGLPTAACPDADGDVFSCSDCDDADAAVNPLGVEQCNGLDDDCDGSVDEDATDAATWYADADGDGFGDAGSVVLGCTVPAGASADATDCDDTSATTYPGAAEVWYDGIDQDCLGGDDDDQDADGLAAFAQGGTDCDDTDASTGGPIFGADCAQPYGDCPATGVVLAVPGDHPDIQSAIAAAPEGAVVCVGPGTWYEALDLLGKGISVVGAMGPEYTTIDASGTGSVITMSSGEPATVTIEGLSLTGGNAVDGGAIYMWEIGTEPTLRNLDLYGNSAEDDGGAIYTNHASPVMEGLDVRNNQTGDSGGGIRLVFATTSITDSVIAENTAGGGGGGIILRESTILLDGVTVEDNVAGEFGGGIEGYKSALTLVDVTLAGNTAAVAGGGYGSFRSDATSGERVVFRDNHAGERGGGLHLGEPAGTSLSSVVVIGNTAGQYGGGISFDEDCAYYMRNFTIVGNVAPEGGAVAMLGVCDDAAFPGPPRLISSIAAFNDGGLYTTGTPRLRVSYSSVYDNGENWDGMSTQIGTRENTAEDPRFVSYSAGLTPEMWDLHLAAGSPAIDAGDPTTFDPDGSVADRGAIGGEAAGAWFLGWYDDADADGLPDGWEVAHGLDPSVPGGAEDGDGDGLTDTEELAAGTWPDLADTDGDGVPDGAEAAAGTDPLDPASADCDGSGSGVTPSWYADADGDAFGDATVWAAACAAPAGFVADATDCDDTNAAVHPGVADPCDGVDDDCDGVVDEDATETSTWYLDADHDGYGDDTTVMSACTQPEGYSAVGGDCDDTTGHVQPGAVEICADGYDNDCSGDAPECVLAGTYTADDSNAQYWGGAGDMLGHDIARAGDTDGDGQDSFWVASAWTDTAGSNSGSVYLLGGAADLHGVDPITAQADATLVGEAASDTSGGAIDGDADVDGDGLPDVVVGAVGNDRGGSNAGSAYLLFGPFSGSISLAAADGIYTGDSAGDQAATAVALLPDIDGVGGVGLAIGGMGDTRGGPGAGAVWVVTTPATGVWSLAGEAKFTGEASSDGAGVAVSRAGDVDGDGLTDLVLGAHQNDAGGANAGAAYVLLAPFSVSVNLSAADAKLTGEAAADTAGFIVADAGDVDGDGLADLYVAAPGQDSDGSNAGAVYLVSGGVTGVSSLAAATAKYLGVGASTQFGVSAANAGDVNGDGVDDFIGGGREWNNGSTSVGAAWVVLQPALGTISMATADIEIRGVGAGDSFGDRATGVGDVDADGLADLAMNATAQDSGGSSSGSVYVFLSPGF